VHQESAMKSTVSGRRSDLDVCLVRRSSSQRPSMDECPSRDGVFKTKIGRRKYCRHWREIRNIWDVTRMFSVWSVRDVLDDRTARYVFRIRKWKRRIHATNIWTNTWNCLIIVLLVSYHICIRSAYVNDFTNINLYVTLYVVTSKIGNANPWQPVTKMWHMLVFCGK